MICSWINSFFKTITPTSTPPSSPPSNTTDYIFDYQKDIVCIEMSRMVSSLLERDDTILLKLEIDKEYYNFNALVVQVIDTKVFCNMENVSNIGSMHYVGRLH